MRTGERHKLVFTEFRYLRTMYGLTRIVRCRNEEVMRGVDVREKMSDRARWKMLTWSGQAECICRELLSKGMHESEVNGSSDRGRLYVRWLN